MDRIKFVGTLLQRSSTLPSLVILSPAITCHAFTSSSSSSFSRGNGGVKQGRSASQTSFGGFSMTIWFARWSRHTHGFRKNLGSFGVFNGSSGNLNTEKITVLNHLNKSHGGKAYGSAASSTFISSFRARFLSSEPERHLHQLYLHPDDDEDDEQDKDLDFPGGKVPITSEMTFIPESLDKRVPCYRVLDDDGELISRSSSVQLSKELAVKMYSKMVTLQIMDTIFYEAQRQGRISFYVSTVGEEATNIASAAALSPDDLVLPQYREAGVLLWRGFTLQEFANQCFGNEADLGKGRQMPIHYGSNKYNYITVSSPIATQLPQAVGVAYSLKVDKKNACAVTYFGDGSTSEGDFHASLNFAAVLEAPVIFFCRNNGWAISTPVEEQFKSDGIVVRGQAYGIRSIRVDGNDALAVYSAIQMARKMSVSEQRPILVEALTYRVGHHSTSDDSTKYRPVNEIEYWKTERNPVNRFGKWLKRNGWWSIDEESDLRKSVKKKVLEAIQVAEKMKKSGVGEMFSDVYDNPPSNLEEQEILLRQNIARHPQDYPSDIPL